MAESYLKTRDYERLLSETQQKKYAAAIREGYFNNYHGIAWRHTFYGAYIWKYPKRTAIIRRFENLLGKLPDWDDITDDNLRDFKDLLDDELSPNSVRVIGAEICALINENKPSKKISSELFSRVMKTKSVPVQPVFLTRAEIRRIDAYQPNGKFSRTVKRLFMIECLTGARFSDCVKMSVYNMYKEGIHKLLKYVSCKNKVEVIVPVDEMLPKYLVPEPNEHTINGTYSYNRALRAICKNCGIIENTKVFKGGKEVHGKKWEFVTSHTGRRSFATNLSKKGVSIEQISLMMGHMCGNVPNIQMTQRYIVGKMKLDYKVIKIFGANDDEDYDIPLDED